MTNEAEAKKIGRSVIFAAWLAVFCLFGYRSTFSVLLGPMAADMGWSVSTTSMGYSLMMVVYAITAFFSGMIIDKYGTKPAFAIGAVFGCLGFILTSFQSTFIGYIFSYSVLAGIATGMLWVSSTTSCRKWYVGASYAGAWGWAFMGAPMAQVLLSLVLKPVLQNMDWRFGMRLLGIVVLFALIFATILGKKNPQDYGLQPFGIDSLKKKGDAKKFEQYPWTVAEAFQTKAVWLVIIAFLTSMMAEFLVWGQLVNFFVQDIGLDLGGATNMYIIIGICGLVTMPLMGKLADKMVVKYGNEVVGRKVMLIIAPSVGVIASILLLLATPTKLMFAAIACVLFSVYWAIEPGGAAGYAGAVFGNKNIGKIWGLSTLIVMGIGPATGTYLGGLFYDNTGSYQASMIYALCSFAASIIAASFLPKKLDAPIKQSSGTEPVNTSL